MAKDTVILPVLWHGQMHPAGRPSFWVSVLAMDGEHVFVLTDAGQLWRVPWGTVTHEDPATRPGRTIIRAALRNNVDGRVVSAPPPARHHHLLRTHPSGHDWEQGFISSDGKFCTREEAKRIAIDARQSTDDGRTQLFSEDVW